MKTSILLLFILAFLAILPGHANSTIFFDDFVASGFPQQWTDFIPGNSGNISQTGGYLTVTDLAASLNTINPLATSAVQANNTAAIIDSNTPDGQLIFMNWKLQPFNMSTSPGAVQRVAELLFGLDVSSPGFSLLNSILWDVSISDNSGYRGMNGQHGIVTFDIIHPMNVAGTCYASGTIIIFNCSQPSIRYSGANGQGQIDLNSQHSFTVEMRLFPVTKLSWIAFRVDNNAWMNVTQKACSCIDPGSAYVSLYPLVYLAYSATGGGCCSSTIHPVQTIATQVDFVLITDYVPATLPAGQLLPSNINPPKTLPNPYNIFGQSDSLVGFMQFQANSIAPGNIYAGGLLLTGIIVTVIAGTLGAIILRLKKGIREMGFMWSLSSLGIVFFNFYCGIVPLWLPAIQTILSAGIVFGIIRTGSASGGIVPD